MEHTRIPCEGTVKSRPWAPVLALIALVVASAAAGIAVERLRSDADRRIEALTARVDELTDQSNLLQADRDRLRAERNRLEARLAARDAPAICPTRYVSTAEADLPAPFTVDYPCSWHVVQDLVERIDAPEREDLQVAITLFGQFPIALIPSDGALAEIELADWSARGESGRPPSLEEWIAEERAAFAGEVEESRFEGGAGATITRLAGVRPVLDTPVRFRILIWEYVDPLTGARHILQATARAPTRTTIDAMDRMARSFEVRQE